MFFDYATVTPIYGPPGTGKTTRCIAIVSDLLEKGVDPRQIAYVAFTKKAAWEATDRVAQKLGITKTGMEYFSTIHAMANRAFKAEFPDSYSLMKPSDFETVGDRLSMPVRGNWKVTDEDLISTGGVAYGPGDFAISQINLARSRRIPLSQQMTEFARPDDFIRFNVMPDKVTWFYNTLQQYKLKEGKYDFADMLDRAIDCNPIPVKYAIIDEAQDLSASQWRICHHLLRGCSRVWIAGDDDQAIYRFSGADAGTFVGMGELDTAEVLHRTYRLPEAIYQYSQKLIQRIPSGQRVPKEFTTQKQGGRVSRDALQHLGLDEGDWLLLVRNRSAMQNYESVLRAKSYTYRIDGRSSVPQGDVGAIKAWETLRTGGAVKRESLKGIYERLGIGQTVERGYKTTVLNKIPEGKQQIVWADLPGLKVGQDCEWYNALLGIKPQQVAYLRGVAKRGELFSEPRIKVNTIHGVKGGEADHVAIMPQMGRLTYEGYVADPMDEHRCAYVAATRAKQSLHILLDGDQGMAYPY